MSKVTFYTVSEDEAGQRIDNFLLARLKGVPKSMIYRVIRKGEVRVNKGRVKPERKLQSGDIVRIPPVRVAEQSSSVSVSTSLRSVLENAVLLDRDGLLVINKPSGIAVHGGSGVDIGLIEALREMGEPNRFLELVHRLDKDTSGCIMIARKRSVLRYLQQGLREKGVIQKRYVALVHGHWPKHARVVDVPLLRVEAPSGERFVRVSSEGKSSVTRFSVLARYATATLVTAEPLTGRTHQIRVHAQHVGCPLIGDTKYGSDDVNRDMAKRGCGRLFLHAQALTFKDLAGAIVNIEAPLPEDLQQVVDGLR